MSNGRLGEPPREWRPPSGRFKPIGGPSPEYVSGVRPAALVLAPAASRDAIAVELQSAGWNVILPPTAGSIASAARAARAIVVDARDALSPAVIGTIASVRQGRKLVAIGEAFSIVDVDARVLPPIEEGAIARALGGGARLDSLSKPA